MRGWFQHFKCACFHGEILFNAVKYQFYLPDGLIYDASEEHDALIAHKILDAFNERLEKEIMGEEC